MADIVLDDLERFFRGQRVPIGSPPAMLDQDDVMKLSFSTLGCPSWSLARVIDAAGRLATTASSCASSRTTTRSGSDPSSGAGGLRETRARLRDAGLRGSLRRQPVVLPPPRRGRAAQTALDEAERIVEIAAELGRRASACSATRVQPGADLASTRAWIVEALATLARPAGRRGVEVWLETHGDFAPAAAVAPRSFSRGRRGRGSASSGTRANAFSEFGEEPEAGARRSAGQSATCT